MEILEADDREDPSWRADLMRQGQAAETRGSREFPDYRNPKAIALGGEATSV